MEDSETLGTLSGGWIRRSLGRLRGHSVPPDPQDFEKIKQRKGDFSASEDHEHGPDGDDGAAAGKDPTPQYTVLPTSINDVTCAPMSAWLLQDAGPWIALQSMDGSGELRH